MFFQSFFYQSNATSDTSADVIIWRNFNALENAYINTANYPQSNSSIFVVTPSTPTTAAPADNQPTLAATVTGANAAATYTIDYTSDDTLLWAANCTSALNATNSSCANMPNNVLPNFNATDSSAKWVSTYSGVTIGGY